MSIHAGPLTAERLREAEHATMRLVPESTLMDRAADAVAAETMRALEARHGSVSGARVVALVGRGNNGGDALLAAARLQRAGADVVAVLVGDDVHTRGKAEFIEAGGRVLDGHAETQEALTEVHHAHVIIDGIVGLGARAGLRHPASHLVEGIGHGTLVIAVDIPSGLEADSSDAFASHVRADVTVTFTAPKRCLLELPAAASAGRVVTVDVGVVL